ncbi:hypothetical protein PE36_15350, partial [Moritella sp. PE36]
MVKLQLLSKLNSTICLLELIMKGNTKVITTLNGLLHNELAAIDQYFTHS